MHIIATISKNSYAPHKIEEILLAGATILRYNFSHGTPEEQTKKIEEARKVIKRLGLEQEVSLLADIPGGKIRLGKFTGDEMNVTEGEEVMFTSASFSDDPKKYIPIDFESVGNAVALGDEITFGDGEMAFVVTQKIDESSFVAKALNAYALFAEKGVNLGKAIDEVDHFTEITKAHIKNIKNINPDFLAFSFVNSQESVQKYKAFLFDCFPEFQGKIIAKIESSLGVENAEAILDEVDGIMVARGDLALTVPYEQMGVIQRELIQKAKAKEKIVIVATQILDSLLYSYIPSRAEISDLTECVLSGVDGIMMAKETGISQTPGYSVKVAKRIIEAVEKQM